MEQRQEGHEGGWAMGEAKEKRCGFTTPLGGIAFPLNPGLQRDPVCCELMST